MLKKYKILMLAIILTATGIVLVLTVWLYGSYQVRKQFFLGFAEHELFDVVQDFYQDNEEEIQRENQNQRVGRVSRFSNALKSKYPNVNIDTVKNLFESQGFWRRGNSDRSGKNDSTSNNMQRRNRHFISSFVFRHINWNPEVIDTLTVRMTQSLEKRDIYTDFKLHLVKLPHENELDGKFYHDRYKEHKTRPILVDPGDNLYLEVDFENPWLYLLKAIAWQIFIAVVLISLLIGTFFYLLDTIKKQNRLATMRKAFVNNMTHELKTPVSTVMAAIESIERYGAKDDKERMNRYLSISRQELEHLSDMIERVLQVDVAETNGVQLNKTWFDFVLLIEECAENARLFARKSVEIDLNSNVEEYQLYADQAHLKNVITNLLDNAIKYAGDEVKIKITVDGHAEGLTFKIQDNGIGIPKSYQKGVFDLFFRVPSGNIHNVKGFGLGLAYVKQILNRHSGTIDLQSEEGLGSTFVVYLPKEAK